MGASPNIDALCTMISGRAEAHGHQLGPWTPVPGDPDTATAAARATACLRCDRVAYARIEAGMQGAIGTALTEACDRLP